MNDSLDSDHKFDSDYENYLSSTNAEEDHFNPSKRRNRMKLLTDSGGHNEENCEWQTIEIAIGGKIWKKTETSSSPGRLDLSIFREVSGQTGDAK